MTLADDPLFKELLDVFLGLLVLARGYPSERLIYWDIICGEYFVLHGLSVTSSSSSLTNMSLYLARRSSSWACCSGVLSLEGVDLDRGGDLGDCLGFGVSSSLW